LVKPGEPSPLGPNPSESRPPQITSPAHELSAGAPVSGMHPVVSAEEIERRHSPMWPHGNHPEHPQQHHQQQHQPQQHQQQHPQHPQRRFFFDEEHGDIRRMVMPYDEHLDAQREYLRNYKQHTLLRRPRDISHLMGGGSGFPGGPVGVNEETVPVLVMPPGRGELHPRLAILANIP